MAAPSSTLSAVRYLAASAKWETEKPYTIAGRVPPGQPKDNFEFDTRHVRIYDVASLEESPTLSTFGFEWVRRDFTESLHDRDSINRHIAGLELVVKSHLGAKAVFTYSQQLRKRLGDHNNPRIRPASNFAHIDMTLDAVQNRLDFNFPESANISTTGHYQMLSVWHPLFSPIEDYPLALCDSRTVSDADLVPCDYVLPNFESESYCVKFNANHRWYYKSDQTENDVLLILNCDSKTGIRTPHTGFLLPDVKPGIRTRENFDAKMIAIF
ncbi:hypothetical protein GGR51DRAFT_187708 [Nemania sp. FL0031]|nr:hypothetical protein GGR51DRAFT_187708 [Nemania sp. FL0031]